MNFLTKKHLSRRTFLRGAGGTIALPLLESMIPAQGRAAAAVPKTRLAFVFFPHGVTMDKWIPAGIGENFEFTPILQPLEPYREYINIVSNTYAPMAYGADASAAANHARSSAVFLSGAKPDEGARIPALGETVDQAAARAIGQDTPLPSIELTVEPGGLASPFRNTISWRTATTPLPMEHNPLVIFEKLFGDGATESERAARRKQARSLLDSVMDQVNALNKQLPAGDRGRLASYLDDVREIERRIHKAEEQMRLASVEVPDTPTGAPATFDDHIKLLFDLQILAFRADITRISTLMLAPELSNAVYPATNIRDGFHNLSHHSNGRSNMDRFAELNTYHHSVFAYFLERMKATADGDGTLLDHSLVLWGSGMSDSNQHNHTPLPMLLAGKASGALKGGRHVRLRELTTHSNLLLTILHKAGVPAESIGDSTDPIAEL
jgi:hypothetical protein